MNTGPAMQSSPLKEQIESNLVPGPDRQRLNQICKFCVDVGEHCKD